MRPLYLARRRTLKGGQHRVVPVDEVAPLVLAELRGVTLIILSLKPMQWALYPLSARRYPLVFRKLFTRTLKLT